MCSIVLPRYCSWQKFYQKTSLHILSAMDLAKELEMVDKSSLPGFNCTRAFVSMNYYSVSLLRSLSPETSDWSAYICKFFAGIQHIFIQYECAGQHVSNSKLHPLLTINLLNTKKTHVFVLQSSVIFKCIGFVHKKRIKGTVFLCHIEYKLTSILLRNSIGEL